ncbi:FimV/HubP family polar landmark protein [Pseudomonas turukhanskensis]|uniref:Peptidoglycan-binding protein LysM n=1 Tax=Pseudomonas turukhanskensis TaxID=1806536 RepID=A0A9W6K782_9PSED|nr:FimV/HubP family polar landmark protein [Pseudomonas turukhanskensis]GLK90795.1 peptidoglycan-binding protein LysM [Pseudomonas turukhanskensis]
MVQVRHLLLGLASGSALYSGLVSALGLGDITLHSALNQPLVADIELLEVGDLTAADMKVRLASDAMYARSGVDRIIFLNDLRFTPMLRGGKSVIRVVSSKPVREPYLNFIVELARPNGQLYREYTLLLDPPNSSAYNSVAATPAASAAASSKPRASAPAAPAKPREVPPAKLGKRYVVASGDSLWTIATRLRAQGSNASQQQLMDDIHALNPQAFGGNDMSRLQVGANLLLPDAAPVAATPTDAAEPPPTLSVVDDAQPVPLPSTPLDPQAEMIVQMQRRLDSELAQHADENTKLQQSLADLQVQVQQLMEQSAAKDRELAELKAKLNAQPPVAPAADTDARKLPPAVVAPTPAPAETNTWLGVAWGLGGLLVLALLGLLFWRRSRQEPQPSPVVVVTPVPTADDDDEFELDDMVTPAAEVAPVAAAPRVAAAIAEPRPSTPSDTLEGANIYIAYGRFSEAAASLRRALDAEPQRSDIRFRLLEVLAQLGDARGFQQEEEILLDAGYADAPIAQLKARHPDLLTRPQTETAQFDVLDDVVLELDDVQPLASAAPPEDDQFNLDDFSLDPDWDVISPFSASARNKAEAANKASNDGEPAADLGQAVDVLSPFSNTAMVVEETHDEGWFGEGLDDDAYLSQPLVEEGASLGDLDHLEARRDNLAKFNQALAFIEQGHLESACDILNELINEGDEEQKREASKLLAKIA